MSEMKLFLISQNINNDYDTWDSAVVAAETVEQARHTSPSPDHYVWHQPEGERAQWYFRMFDGTLEASDCFSAWVDNPSLVAVKYLGEATPGLPAGVVCASYNAG